MKTTTKTLMDELGTAWRGDWSGFDGRTLESQLSYIVGFEDNPSCSLADARRRLNLCPFGKGHWAAYCEDCGEQEPAA